MTPGQQELAFDSGLLDVGFTRVITAERSKTFSSRLLYSDPLMAVLPKSRQIKTKRIPIADLSADRFVLFHREGSPVLYDTIIGLCNQAGFCPKIENEADALQTVLSLVEAEEGIAIVPACTRNLRSDGVTFYRLQPDEAWIELVITWKTSSQSVVLHTFLDLVEKNAVSIRAKAELC
jgi:DNA-binding transcriptional LysR family regulator